MAFLLATTLPPINSESVTFILLLSSSAHALTKCERFLSRFHSLFELLRLDQFPSPALMYLPYTSDYQGQLAGEPNSHSANPSKLLVFGH